MMVATDVMMRVQAVNASAPVPTVSIPRDLSKEEIAKLAIALIDQYGDFRMRFTDDNRIEVAFRPLFEHVPV